MADLQVRIAYLENALAWIRHTAGMHYMGAAFEPEHMRHLANMAADAILGEREFPGIDGAYRQAQERAQEFAAKWREPLGWDGPRIKTYTVTRWADGRQHTSPWQEVSGQ